MPTFPVDQLPVNAEDRELIRKAFDWLEGYLTLCNPDVSRPAPVGTPYEAWSVLTLVHMLHGFSMTRIDPLPDFIARSATVIQRLESA